MRSSILILLYGIVAATGAAGLIYQVAWQKYISRILGSDSIAIAIILGTFLGGLSLGYYLCGKCTVWVKNHFKGYAILEAIIGIWCLLFPNIFHAVDSFTSNWSFSAPFGIVVQGIFTSVLLLGLPTVCMGGTIPFLTRGISRNLSEATRVHAKVYAINTGGAFVGTLLAGFYLIPTFGLPFTIRGTAFLNLIAFAFFLVLSLKAKGGEEEERKAEEVVPEQPLLPQEGGSRYPIWSLYLIGFLSGFYVMTLENVLIRLTNISLGSSSYSFTMIVSVFVLSIAIGSYAVGRMERIPRQLLFVNQLLITLCLLVIFLTLDSWSYYAHLLRITFASNAVGFWGYYCGVLVVLTTILILPVGLMGATVPIAFHELKRDLRMVGKHSGQLFSWNTLGNLLGSLVGGIVLYYFMNNPGVFISAVLFAALSTLLAARYIGRKYTVTALGLVAVVLVSTLFTSNYNTHNIAMGVFRERAPLPYSFLGPEEFYKNHIHWDVLFYDDDSTAQVSVIDIEGGDEYDIIGRSIVVNGKSDSNTLGDIETLRLSAHVSALLAKNRKQCLVVGLGTGVTAGELLLYPEVEHIDVAEISPAVVEAVSYFKEANYDLEADERVEFFIGDAFRVLRRSQKKWDVIISEPSNPWVMGVDMLFTSEYYKLVSEHLEEGGILAQWCQYYAANPEWICMIVNTLHEEFPHSRVFMSNPGDLLIIASKEPITRERVAAGQDIIDNNKAVRESLRWINMDSIDSILLRELWPPSFIDTNFSNFGFQTMDEPRLHYMAGKSFFLGERVGANFMLTPAAASYHEDFLMTIYSKGWKKYPRSLAQHHSYLRSFDSKLLGKAYLPQTKFLKLKAYLTDPDTYPLDPAEKQSVGADFLPFIMTYPQSEEAWQSIGLGRQTIRRKVELIQTHMDRFRNWINPYPLDGLIGLLRKGMDTLIYPGDKNWCAIHLTMLFIREHRAQAEIDAVMTQLVRDEAGQVIVDDKDKPLLDAYNKMLESL